MPENTSCLIFTDLDGTLLDHFTYSHQEAQAMIVQLTQDHIPIIINTSKTFAEVVEIQATLNIKAPFIIENGAAVLLPKSLFKHAPAGCKSYENYWLKPFSQPRQVWIDLLADKGKPFAEQFQGFSQLTNKTIANLTGLSLEKADKANQRLFNEPVLWHDDQEKAQVFIDAMKASGANVLKGGRFIHIGDYTDKGNALNWLANLYQKLSGKPVTTIALGDGENDTAMLEAADIAVQVRSPVHPFPTLTNANFIYRSQAFGPKGWSQALAFLYPTLSKLAVEQNTIEETQYG